MSQEVINQYSETWNKVLGYIRRLQDLAEEILEEEEISSRLVEVIFAKYREEQTNFRRVVRDFGKIRFLRDKVRVDQDLRKVEEDKKDSEKQYQLLKDGSTEVKKLAEEINKTVTLIGSVIKALKNQKTPASQVQKTGLPPPPPINESSDSSESESDELPAPKAKAKARPKAKAKAPSPKAKPKAKAKARVLPPLPEEPPKSRGGRNKKELPGNLQRYYEALVDFHNRGLIDQKKKIPEKYRAYVLGHLRKGSFDPQTGADLRKRKRKTQFDDIIDIFRAKEKK